MVFDSVWNIWPFRKIFSSKNTRRHAKHNSRSFKGQESLIQFLGPWESNMVALQSILIWERPGKSILAIFAANLIYWYFAYSEIRFFFGVSILGLAAFLHHQWVHSIWPEICVPKSQTDQEDWTPVNPSVLSAPEVGRYLKNSWTYVKKQKKLIAELRRKQPGLFCIGMATAFCLLWLIGHFVSGRVLLYTLLMGVMCGPAFVIHFIPKSVFKQIEQIISVVFGKTSGTPENEYAEFLLEEANPDVQTALGIPLNSTESAFVIGGAVNLKSAQGGRRGRGGRGGRGRCNTSLEVGNSFISGLSPTDFPSLEESLDGVEESDLALEPIVPKEGEGERKGASRDEGINFVATHFGDSSDDDDDFELGLSFRRTNERHTETDSGAPSLLPSAATAVMTHLVGNMAAENTATLLSSIGQQIVSAAIGATGNQPPLEEKRREEEEEEAKRRIMISSDSSFEDEFELISDDDLQ